jgi:hypothetical protein
MKEKLSVIQNSLSGKWTDGKYEFLFKGWFDNGKPNIAILASPTLHPEISSYYDYDVYEKGSDCYLRFVQITTLKKKVYEYKIDSIDPSKKKMKLSNEGGQAWEFTHVGKIAA